MFLICLYYCDARTISSEIAHSLLCLYSIFSFEYLIYGLHAFVCLVAHNLFQYCYVWIVVSSFRESDIQSSAMFPLNFFSPLFCSVFQSAVIFIAVQSFFAVECYTFFFQSRLIWDPLQVFPCVTMLRHCLQQITSVQVICTASNAKSFCSRLLAARALFPFLSVNKNP